MYIASQERVSKGIILRIVSLVKKDEAWTATTLNSTSDVIDATSFTSITLGLVKTQVSIFAYNDEENSGFLFKELNGKLITESLNDLFKQICLRRSAVYARQDSTLAGLFTIRSALESRND